MTHAYSLQPNVTQVLVYRGACFKGHKWCADLIWTDGGVWRKWVIFNRRNDLLGHIRGYGMQSKVSFV